MAGPLAGLGAQPQIPLATPSQTSQNSQQQAVREQQQQSQPAPNQVQQQQSAPPAQAQQSESNNYNVLQNQQDSFLSASNDPVEQSNQPRGSLVDITI